MKTSTILLLIVLLATSVLANKIIPPQDFEGQVFNSTMALYSSVDDKSRYDCTISPYEKIEGGYLLATAGHCVQLTSSRAVYAVADEIGGPLTPVILVKSRMDATLDFAVFKLLTDKQYIIVPWDDTSDLQVGDNVFSVNFAEGVAKQLSHGQISSQILSDSRECSRCSGSFLIQMYGGDGSSGALVVSPKTHKVIGMVVFRFESNIGFGIEPIGLFKVFMAEPDQEHFPDDILHLPLSTDKPTK